MKTPIRLLVCTFLLTFALNTKALDGLTGTVNNTGTTPFPSASSLPSGHLLVTFSYTATTRSGSLNVDAAGVSGGSYAYYYDNPGGAITLSTFSVTCGDPNMVLDSTSIGSAGGVPQMIANYHYNTPAPCTTNISFSWVNTTGGARAVSVIDSTVSSSPHMYDQQLVAAGGTYTDVIPNVLCDEVVFYQLQISDFTTNTVITATNAPDIYPTSTEMQTNMNLWTPSNLANLSTNNAPIWTNITTDISGIIGAVEQGAANTMNSVGANGNATAAAIGNFSDNVTSNATANANGIIGAVDKVRIQAHSDANVNTAQILGGLQVVTDAIGHESNSVNVNFTNYNQETTQVGISNLLYSISTNFYGATVTNDPNAQAGQGASVGVGGSNELAGVTGGLPQGDADAADSSLGSNDATWTVSIPFGSGYTIDLNPFHVSWVVSLAAWVRGLIKWLTLTSLVITCSKMLLSALQAAGANRQATEAGVAGIFSEIPIVASAVSLGCALAITLVTAGIITFAVHWFGHYMTSIATSPFASVAGVSTAVWMVDQFFPIAVMVGAVFSGIIFTYSLAAIVWFVQTVTRFITG